ncbi:MAG: dehydratase [Chloroflexi bacterium]|nr:dehydratase [Chloroflexota bacterium]MBM3172883.1 dehydratase [Chloroflexota bacterium]MBM3174407.1 dehydratase [Chloroflexota bacterium]MBM4449969.1 dehydratase [Chloroflexota bacterium]
MPKYWEDYQLGEKFTTPGRTVSEGMINIMVGLAGFTLPLFWDEEAAGKTAFGMRIAPGRLTLLFMGGLEEQCGFWEEETMIALVGIDKVRITSPLRPGDTLRVYGEVIEKRETKNPQRGIIVHRSTCKNQKGETVAETESAHLVKRRGGL